jgi:hypothetical protein
VGGLVGPVRHGPPALRGEAGGGNLVGPVRHGSTCSERRGGGGKLGRAGTTEFAYVLGRKKKEKSLLRQKCTIFKILFLEQNLINRFFKQFSIHPILDRMRIKMYILKRRAKVAPKAKMYIFKILFLEQNLINRFFKRLDIYLILD